MAARDYLPALAKNTDIKPDILADLGQRQAICDQTQFAIGNLAIWTTRTTSLRTAVGTARHTPSEPLNHEPHGEVSVEYQLYDGVLTGAL